MKRQAWMLWAACLFLAALKTSASTLDTVPRPILHFTPPGGFMNDPNGLIFHKGNYHLFFQYLPPGEKKAKHWGHALSPNLLSWKHAPIALYPDSLGAIWSGSVVLDEANSSGLGNPGQPPLVAIFTHKSQVPNKQRPVNNQYQSLAYSVDDGQTWTKYPGNPVLWKADSKAFRDPKVFAYNDGWMMVLAVQDHVEFYTSPNLKEWKQVGSFGAGIGAHGGVWECPDLFPLKTKGATKWVLVVSVAKGAPAGGSGTQYFIGDFDGQQFFPQDTLTRWLDYGPDNYAGIVFNNTGEEKIFLGWMNNWQYASKLPDPGWRGSMTLPQKLGLQRVSGKWVLKMDHPSPLENYWQLSHISPEITDNGWRYSLPPMPLKIEWEGGASASAKTTLLNAKGESFSNGFDADSGRYWTDRANAYAAAPVVAGFGNRFSVPGYLQKQQAQWSLVLDHGSAELSGDGGLVRISQQLWPHQPFTMMIINQKKDGKRPMLRVYTLKK